MQAVNAPLNRKLRMGLIGGGGKAFIGPVHSVAATLDHRAELVAGALSSDAERARDSAIAFGIASDRAYGSYRELIESESQLPADQRIDFITIATPNNTHFEIAAAALQAGFHVVCDKPLTTDLDQAEQLAALVEQTGAVFAVTFCYATYPMVRQIRAMVAAGELGEVQAARVSYIQGGLRRMQPGQPQERAAWKADPNLTGPSGTMADIGVHAYHLLRYASGLEPVELSAHLATFHPVRPLEDYGHVVLRCNGGALGMVTASQVTHGRLNDISLEIDGTTGSLVWRHEEPEIVTLRRHAQPIQIFERNRRAGYLDHAAQAACRLPGGHSEGYYEAFANIYQDAFDDMVRHAEGQRIDSHRTAYPNVHDGAEGVRFVQACIASGKSNGWWQPF